MQVKNPQRSALNFFSEIKLTKSECCFLIFSVWLLDRFLLNVAGA